MKKTSTVAKSFVIVFTFLTFIPSVPIYSQACYNPYVEYIISQTSLDTICRVNRELSGDTLTYIGGLPYLIYSRVYDSPANEKAAEYIMQKFTGWGMTARYQRYSDSGKNVIAYKIGTKYPDKQFIICAHYDNYTSVPADTTFGADDNASGVCGVLEAARVLRPYTFDYTIVFIAFDEEELWMVGSYAYVDSAYERGDSILGVINLDMVGYDSDNNNIMTVNTDTNSIHLANVIFSSCNIYQPHLKPVLTYGGASDHLPFWEKGYKASMLIEDLRDFNRYYHTIDEKFDKLNPPYMHSIIKAAIAALVVLEKDFIINLGHVPLVSSYDTASRTATVVISSNSNIAKGSNRPRLYYKTETTGYVIVNAYYVNQDTFKFLIPGFIKGTMVNYYFAAQDSAQTMIGTLPSGGMGMSPPGTTPPPVTFSYHILDILNVCSENLPKNIPPNKIVYDSIFIGSSKSIFDLDIDVSIMHIRDEDLYINILKSGFFQTELSTNNGGSGSNYINTVFDDEADTSIINGTPPFTGHYRPETAVSKFDNSSTNGYWVIKILNLSATDTAKLVNWCLNFNIYNPIGINNNQSAFKFKLGQNYPNPFNAVTKINYEIVNKSYARITIYDMLGREVKELSSGEHTPGKYEVFWDAAGFSSGVYFYRLVVGDASASPGTSFTESRKMILIK